MGWFFPKPVIMYTCVSCHREVQLRVDDVFNKNAVVPDECPSCGNQGQNWIHCRACNRWVKAKVIPENWSEDFCPRCAGKEISDDMFTDTHAFVFPEFSEENLTSNIRCAQCGELGRHYVHELDEDEDLDDEQT